MCSTCQAIIVIYEAVYELLVPKSVTLNGEMALI